MKQSLIRVRFTEIRCDGGPVWMPLVPVRLSRGVFGTRAMTALVDSGAAFTMGPLGLTELLRVSAEDLAAAPKVLVSGLGGRPERCPLVSCDLDIGGVGQRLVLSNTPVLLTASAMPVADFLIGQRDALGCLEFFHRNQDGVREFVLRRPPP